MKKIKIFLPIFILFFVSMAMNAQNTNQRAEQDQPKVPGNYTACGNWNEQYWPDYSCEGSGPTCYCLQMSIVKVVPKSKGSVQGFINANNFVGVDKKTLESIKSGKFEFSNIADKHVVVRPKNGKAFVLHFN